MRATLPFCELAKLNKVLLGPHHLLRHLRLEHRRDLFVVTLSSLAHPLTLPSVAAIRAACAHLYPTTVRPTLDLEMTATWSIKGTPGGEKSATGRIAGLNCPIQFSSSAS